MKHYKGRYQCSARNGRQFRHGGDQNTRQQHRECNTGFHTRQAHAGPSDARTKDHATDHEQGCAVFQGGGLAHAPEPNSGRGQRALMRT